jgi:hypothetical protein
MMDNHAEAVQNLFNHNWVCSGFGWAGTITPAVMIGAYGAVLLVILAAHRHIHLENAIITDKEPIKLEA